MINVILTIYLLALSCFQSYAFTIGGTKNTNNGSLLPGITAEVVASTFVPAHRRKISTSLYDKWDDLVDEDDEVEIPEWLGPPIPKDMKYNEFNLKRQYSNCKAIRTAGGPEMTNDIFARDPDTDVFWFAGKVARISDVSLAKAVARQYPLIEEHSARLRPLELFDKNGLLELWAAPGDSELDVAYNRPTARFVKMARAQETEGADDVKNREVGFQGEIYEAGEEGFRTQRKEDGMPLNPEIVA
jgi:hypothetical protein